MPCGETYFFEDDEARHANQTNIKYVCVGKGNISGRHVSSRVVVGVTPVWIAVTLACFQTAWNLELSWRRKRTLLWWGKFYKQYVFPFSCHAFVVHSLASHQLTAWCKYATLFEDLFSKRSVTILNPFTTSQRANYIISSNQIIKSVNVATVTKGGK